MVGRVYLGRYQAMRLLGEGGMGRVYLAKQLDLGRQVVVKVMHDHIVVDLAFRERFERETLLMARFQHPYAVTLYDARLDSPDGPCIVMEYIRGITLEKLMEENQRLSSPRAGRLLGQLCEVLLAAHNQGIVHRDLKPANLMVVEANSPYEKIKVMDFGLATLLNPRTLRKETNSDAEFAIGTPGYMCPEQIKGEPMDHRGDLYSVGVLLFEMLAGKRPFSDRSAMDTMLAHANEAPPTFAEIGAKWVARPVEKVVHKCLEKDPNNRPSTARELAELYELALEEELMVGTESSPAKAEQEITPSIITINDPQAIVHELEAWMPEQIATYKLRGFVHDVGGQVVETVPGRIRVRIGGQRSAYVPRTQGALSWLGLGRRCPQIELELCIQRIPSERSGHLHLTVLMRPFPRGNCHDADFRARCEKLYCDLRSYLMGTTAVAAPA
jgi:serine/threonine-protein kinase